MNSTNNFDSDVDTGDKIIGITSLIGIFITLVMNMWQTLMMKNIKLESKCCESCFIELSESEK